MLLSEKKQWLSECESLLTYYKRGEGVVSACVFCGHVMAEENLSNTCSRCIWVGMEGVTCCDWAEREGFDPAKVSLYRDCCNKAWVAKRVPMLKTWIRVLKADIADDEVSDETK